MAKRDVVEYFLNIENEYLEMIDNVKEMKVLLEEGKINQLDYDQIVKETELIKTNYERLAYILFLLNMPNRKEKRRSVETEKLYSYLKYASKEAVLDETQDALKKIKELLYSGELHE